MELVRQNYSRRRLEKIYHFISKVRSMAKIEVTWVATRPAISIFDEARDLGFDLRKFEAQIDEVKTAVKKACIDQIVRKIRKTWEETNESGSLFNDVKNGVYVISISSGFGVKYKFGCSEIMYIGRGVISNRLRSHLNNWIFGMSLSLRDVPFKFYMESIGDGRSADAYKDFEHYLLEQFKNKFGEKPLLNKIRGRAGSIDHAFGGNWNSPLDNRGKRYHWEIRPTSKNEWFKEQEDE